MFGPLYNRFVVWVGLNAKGDQIHPSEINTRGKLGSEAQRIASRLNYATVSNIVPIPVFVSSEP